MKDHLIFDVTDANTILDSDSVGAFLRAGTDGDLISSGDGDSDSVANTFEGIDTRGFMFGYDSVGDHWDRLRATNGALHVDIQDAAITVDSSFDKDEDSAHASGDNGAYVLAVRADARPTDANTSADGDYASFFVNDSGELYVKDTDAAALLTTIDADTGAIATDIAAIETELLDQGTTLDSILSDTNALVVDLAAIETELLDQGTSLDALVVDAAAIEAELLAQGTTLDSILSDTSALVVDAAAIEAELLDQGTTLDSIESELQGLSHAEDAAHASGDLGIQTLAVRNDTLAALAGTDGDYAPLQVDADGALYVNVSNAISVEDVALANTAIANAANALTAANTAENVVASPLASRKYLWIYNNGNRKAYIGASGVSAANGFPVSPGSYIEMRAGAAVDIEWVSANTNQEIRTLELS